MHQAVIIQLNIYLQLNISYGSKLKTPLNLQANDPDKSPTSLTFGFASGFNVSDASIGGLAQPFDLEADGPNSIKLIKQFSAKNDMKGYFTFLLSVSGTMDSFFGLFECNL